MGHNGQWRSNMQIAYYKLPFFDNIRVLSDDSGQIMHFLPSTVNRETTFLICILQSTKSLHASFPLLCCSLDSVQ